MNDDGRVTLSRVRAHYMKREQTGNSDPESFCRPSKSCAITATSGNLSFCSPSRCAIPIDSATLVRSTAFGGRRM